MLQSWLLILKTVQKMTKWITAMDLANKAVFSSKKNAKGRTSQMHSRVPTSLVLTSTKSRRSQMKWSNLSSYHVKKTLLIWKMLMRNIPLLILRLRPILQFHIIRRIHLVFQPQASLFQMKFVRNSSQNTSRKLYLVYPNHLVWNKSPHPDHSEVHSTLAFYHSQDQIEQTKNWKHQTQLSQRAKNVVQSAVTLAQFHFTLNPTPI